MPTDPVSAVLSAFSKVNTFDEFGHAIVESWAREFGAEVRTVTGLASFRSTRARAAEVSLAQHKGVLPWLTRIRSR